ncbi:M36 family metallopeptidase, partial [Winogradskyella sp.]|uniref:M36 family metallopeptidase n=1 Tax=Winogradskyella sp. TaxID=1883156 RepID=UPI003F6BEA1D
MIKNSLRIVLLFVIAISSINVYSQNSLESSEFGEVITNYLNDRKSDFDFEDEDIARLVVNDQFYSEITDLNNVYVNQTFQGIRIYNAISSIAIRNNEVFYYANRFLKDIEEKVNTTNPSQSPVAAVNSLANNFQLGVVQNLQQLEANGYKFIFSNGNISTRNITAELVFVNTENQLKLAWDIMVYANDDKHWYSTRVDAVTNEIIETNNLILTCTFDRDHTHNEASKDFNFYNNVSAPSTMLVDGSSYNVFALPTESPNHGPRQIVTNPASTLASPFGWHDDDGLPGAEYTVTRGNNVLAQEDRDGIRFTPGFTPDGTTNLNFDFPLDMNQPPEGYEE